MKQDLTQASYSSALIPDTFTVCGVPLKPLCLGHIMLLEAIKSPIVAEEVQQVERQEAISYFFLSLLICSQTYEDGLELLNNPKELNLITTQFSEHLLTSMKTEKGWNIYNKIQLFKKYMAHHLESMPYYDFVQEQKGDETPSGNDWKNGIFIVFKKLGYSQSEILNMNIKKLFMEWTGWAESEGQIKVCNKYAAETLKKFEKKRKE